MSWRISKSDKPVVLLRPAPQTISRIFTDDARRRVHERSTVGAPRLSHPRGGREGRLAEGEQLGRILQRGVTRRARSGVA